MSPWSRLPALRILLGYAAGCCLALLLPAWVWWCVLGALPVAGVVSYRMRSPAPLFWAMLIVAGVVTGDAATGLPFDVGRTPDRDLPAVVSGRIERIVRRDTNAVRCLVRGTVDTRPLPAHTGTGILLTVVRPDSLTDALLRTGNRIAATATVRLPQTGTLPGEFNERSFYASLGVEWFGTAFPGAVALVERGGGVRAWLDETAATVREAVRRLFPERTQGIAVALVTGDRSLLPRETRELYTLTGTAHVLAVSGLHVGILAALILLPLARLRRPLLRLLLFTAALVAYTALTGVQPSMVRATVMAVLVLLATQAQREASLLNTLCCTVVVMLAADPSLLFSPGFHLSVASLAGIGLLYPGLDRLLGLWLVSQSRPVVFVRRSLAMTLAASAAVSPLVAVSFSVFSVVSPLANLAVIPLTSLGMVYTLCALCTGPVAGWMASAFAATADLLFTLAGTVNGWAAALPFAAVRGGEALWCALGASAATVYIAAAERRRTALFRTAVSAVAVVLLLVLILPGERPVEVLPRRQVVAVVVPLSDRRDLVLMQDRRPDGYPQRDMGLEHYLASRAGRLAVIACGPASLRCAASLPRTAVDAVIAQTLTFKNRGLWPALDTLAARGVRVVNAEAGLAGRTPVELQGRSMALRWDPWRNSVVLHTASGSHTLVLPAVPSGPPVVPD